MAGDVLLPAVEQTQWVMISCITYHFCYYKVQGKNNDQSTGISKEIFLSGKIQCYSLQAPAQTQSFILESNLTTTFSD